MSEFILAHERKQSNELRIRQIALPFVHESADDLKVTLSVMPVAVDTIEGCQ